MADQFKEAVCVDAGRVYDSCCDRDCLEDLRLFFNPSDQLLVNQAIGVRARSATLLNTIVDVESVTFNKGYYSVDILFFFLVAVDLYGGESTTYTTVNGLCSFCKKVILYGGEGSARVFSSNTTDVETETTLPTATNNPTAYVQTVDPIILSASICQCCGFDCAGTINAPAPVLATIGGSIAPAETVQRKVLTSLGIFTIVQIVRNVQMLMPVYDFCVPNKECVTGADEPCDVFNRLDFPMEQFFPPQEPCDLESQRCCESSE